MSWRLKLRHSDLVYLLRKAHSAIASLSDNLVVIDIMKNGGHSAGAAATEFDDC